MSNFDLKIAQQRVATFTYRTTFIDASPSFSYILGYPISFFQNATFSDIIIDGTGSLIPKALESISIDKQAGGLSDTVDLLTSNGGYVRGKLSLEWYDDENPLVFGTFTVIESDDALSKGIVSRFISDISLSAHLNIDQDYNVISADSAFEMFFKVSDIEGSNLSDILSKENYDHIVRSLKNEEDCCSILLDNAQLIAIIERNIDNTLIRFYGKEYLLNAYFPYSLSTIQIRKLIWDNVPLMLFIDPESKSILEANRSAAAFYGYQIEEFAGMPVSNINTLPLDVLSQELELAASGKKNFFICRHRTASGQLKDVNETTTPVVVCGKTYLFVLVSDITRRKMLEKVIEEKNRMLTELNVGLSKMVQEEMDERRKKEQLFMQQSRLIAMGEMVGAIAHHWRQPLNTIGLLVQDMEDANNYGELNSKYIEDMVRKVMSHLHTMSLSIDNFRNFFRPSKDKNIFDAKAAVSNVVKLISAQFKHFNITICIRCTCDISKTCDSPEMDDDSCSHGYTLVSGYYNEFKQVILNILTNSQDAINQCKQSGLLSDDDEGLVFVGVSVRDSIVTLTFDDNGGGLDESVITRAFEPYFTTKTDGSGIGLYMAKTFIETNMSGKMYIENISEGCRLTMSIPAANRTF